MNKIHFILIFIVAVALVDGVYAVRISPDSVRIEFQPNLEQSYLFKAGGAPKIEVYKKGDLADYVYFNQTVLDDDSYFVVTVKLPSHIDTPGDNIVFIGAREFRGTAGGTVGGIAAIQAPIVIRVPYPGIYPSISFNMPEFVNADEIIPITIDIQNFGTNDIMASRAAINIFDPGGNQIQALLTDQQPVKSKSAAALTASLNTTGMKAGIYKGTANVTFDGNYQAIEKNFRVGVLSVNILNYTKDFLKDKIGIFEIEVQSMWSGRIDNAFAEIEISNSTKTMDALKTPAGTLEPWQKIKLSTFLDTTGLGEGRYNAKISIFYSGTSSTLDGEVAIFSPQESHYLKYLNTTAILIALAALLIIFNLIFLLKRKRKAHWLK